MRPAVKKATWSSGTALLVLVVIVGILADAQVAATRAETEMVLPGDDLIPAPLGSVNHAITIHAAARDVWPWLAQMGAGRAGWYAYDVIDNEGHASAERILPEYQNVTVGTIFPATPGAKDVFRVVRCEPGRDLVLSWELPDGKYQTTWAFVLDAAEPGETRLIVRGRVASGYRPYGLPQWFAVTAGRLAHFAMERKQLLGIARRAERLKSR